MIAEHRIRESIRLAMPVVVAIAASLVISLPSEVSAQSTWSDALVSFLARLTMAQGTKSAVQSKTGGKGDVTIQSMTAGKIAKFTTNGSGQIADSVIAESNGNIGIGTANPLTVVHVGAGTALPVTSGATLLVENGVATSAVIKSTGGGEMFFYQDNINGTFGTASTHPLGIRTNNENRIWIQADGKVGIGTLAPAKTLDVVGDIYASGTISGGNVIAKYQDVAEWVPANRAMPAGTVVTLDPEHSNLVVSSSRSYDTRVAGVVSEKPGVILGEGGEGKVMVATNGRVRVKVDATNGPIRVGDLLVTSDKEGTAMRSLPLDLGGTPIHRPGTLIGKALEPLEKGAGEILVLLSLQ